MIFLFANNLKHYFEDTDAVALAEYFTTVTLGMALRAKDNAMQTE
jgi:hypothetical protein